MTDVRRLLQWNVLVGQATVQKLLDLDHTVILLSLFIDYLNIGQTAILRGRPVVLSIVSMLFFLHLIHFILLKT